MRNEIMADLIREKHAGMTISIEAQLGDGSWLPVGGHGCYTDDEARAYVAEFNTAEYPLRTRLLHEVFPDLWTPPPHERGGVE